MRAVPRSLTAVIVATLALAAWTGSMAFEPGAHVPYFAGSGGGVPIGAMPPPDLYLSSLTTYFEGLAHTDISPRHRSELQLLSEGLTLLWVPDIKLLGGSYGALVNQAVVVKTITNIPPRGVTSTETGLVNTAISPLNLAWTLPSDFYVSTRFAFYPPDGQYNRNNVVNIANNFWTFEPNVGISYLLLGLSESVGAQRPAALPRVGFLGMDSQMQVEWLAEFQDELRARGYVDGRTIAIEYRWAEGRFDRLPELAVELVGLKVDVIVTAAPPAVRAAQRATTTIPIVMTVHDPVGMGFVQSLAHPGGNITGLAFQDAEFSTKRLDLLRQAVPRLARVAVLWNREGGGVAAVQAVETAARALGLQVLVPGPADPRRRTRVPGRGPLDRSDPDKPAGGRPARKGGARLATQIEQPGAFDLMINSRCAKAPGLSIPPALVLGADEVLE